MNNKTNVISRLVLCRACRSGQTTAILLWVIVALGFACRSGNAQTVVPTDANTGNVPGMVPLDASIFDPWFASGSVTFNGAVNPANSLSFTNFANWAFYQWAENMFLWLTSPAPGVYGGGGRVLTSPVFYNVSPPDQNGNRTLAQNATGGGFIRMALRKAQVGPEALPIVRDQTGKIYNVEPLLLGPTGRPLMVDRLGRSVEVQRVRVGPTGTLTLLDRADKVIEPRLGPDRAPILLGRTGSPIRLERVIPGLNGSFIFLDQFGNAIEFGEGQADGSESVLMAQNGSLVYFSIFVNDEYAYFLTGNKDGDFAPAQPTFPTNTTQMQQIYSLAAAHGHILTDSNTLAMEVKTAWIETQGLDASKYVTIHATIPTYDTSNPGVWVTNGTKQAQLALVGIHIVGSAANNPGMIWATFEHINNTPDAIYSYTATAPAGSATPLLTKTVPQNTAGNWLFCASGSAGPFNVPRITVDPANGTLTAQGGGTIGPSDTLRVMAWGASTNETPNPIDPTAPDSNAEIIDINTRAHQMLAAGDVRANYILIGATFSGLPSSGSGPSSFFFPNGDIPSSASVPYPGGNNPPNNAVIDETGTSQMSDSTLETYSQASHPAYGLDNNCFLCHEGNPLGASDGSGLSHIYGQIKPLF